MKFIQLGGNRYKDKPIRGYTMVDNEDFDFLSEFDWYIHNGYACCHIKQQDGQYKTTRMARLIMNASIGQLVDHIDRDKLNNQRNNLRFANKSINSLNRDLQSNNKSGFRGVHFEKQTNKWRAELHSYDKHIRLGRFVDPKEAALAYNKAAKEFFGDFAVLNVV